jgi:hypothetical protein
MGTRSRIAVMHGEVCKSVYCHWDGYLSGVGATLLAHYDSARANHLVALGDISSLGSQIGSAHPFSKFEISADDAQREAKLALVDQAEREGWTTFYGRDRGESNTEFQTDTTFEAFLSRVDNCGAEFYYVMKDGVWYVGNVYESDLRFYKQLVPLQDALATEESAA